MDLLCAGPHADGLAPVLGTTDQPTSTGPLCEPCGLVYRAAVAAGTEAISELPTPAKIAADLPKLKPAADLTSYKPPKVKP